MRILYIAPYTSSSFRARHGDINPPSFGGNRKISLILEALSGSHHNVLMLSSAMLSNSSIALRPATRETITFEHGGSVSIVYPKAFMLRPVGGLVNCFRAAGFVRDVIAEFEPDAAIVYNTYLFETRAAKELLRHKQIPLLLEIEDLPLARKRGILNLKPYLDKLCWNPMLSSATAYTAVNQSILDKLPNNKPKALFPGIIDPELVEISRLRPLPFKREQKIVGYFGALTPEKGVGVLLDLVPRLTADWKLVVTGSGPLSVDFERLAQKFPERFQFLGGVSVSRLYEAMCLCDCVVVPQEQITGSSMGVYPFKVLEYLISGAHIISTPLAPQGGLDLSFIMRWDGKCDSLTAALKSAEADFEKEYPMRKEALNFVLERYSLSGVADLLRILICS